MCGLCKKCSYRQENKCYISDTDDFDKVYIDFKDTPIETAKLTCKDNSFETILSHNNISDWLLNYECIIIKYGQLWVWSKVEKIYIKAKDILNSKILDIFKKMSFLFNSGEGINKKIMKLRDDWRKACNRKFDDRFAKNIEIDLFSKLKNQEFKDSPINLIRLRDVIFDLDSFTPLEPTPEHFFASKFDFPYLPDARNPKFIYLMNKFIPEPNDRTFLLEFTSTCFIRNYDHKKICFIIGDTNTLKSTFVEIIRTFLGEKNCSAVSLEGMVEDKYFFGAFSGILANFGAEILSEMREEEVGKKKVSKEIDKLKKLTGGDELEARVIYGHLFKFINYAKLFFTGNEMINFGTPDRAMI